MKLAGWLGASAMMLGGCTDDTTGLGPGDGGGRGDGSERVDSGGPLDGGETPDVVDASLLPFVECRIDQPAPQAFGFERFGSATRIVVLDRDFGVPVGGETVHLWLDGTHNAVDVPASGCLEVRIPFAVLSAHYRGQAIENLDGSSEALRLTFSRAPGEEPTIEVGGSTTPAPDATGLLAAAAVVPSASGCIRRFDFDLLDDTGQPANLVPVRIPSDYRLVLRPLDASSLASVATDARNRPRWVAFGQVVEGEGPPLAFSHQVVADGSVALGDKVHPELGRSVRPAISSDEGDICFTPIGPNEAPSSSVVTYRVVDAPGFQSAVAMTESGPNVISYRFHRTLPASGPLPPVLRIPEVLASTPEGLRLRIDPGTVLVTVEGLDAKNEGYWTQMVLRPEAGADELQVEWPEGVSLGDEIRVYAHAGIEQGGWNPYRPAGAMLARRVIPLNEGE